MFNKNIIARIEKLEEQSKIYLGIQPFYEGSPISFYYKGKEGKFDKLLKYLGVKYVEEHKTEGGFVRIHKKKGKK